MTKPTADDRSPTALARSAGCDLDRCTLAAVFDTGRCLPHQEPVPRPVGIPLHSVAKHVRIERSAVEAVVPADTAAAAGNAMQAAADLVAFGHSEETARTWLAHTLGRIFG